MALPSAAPLAAEAEEPVRGWQGNGELGIAAARGNTRSESLDGKLESSNEDDPWKHDHSLAALRYENDGFAPYDHPATFAMGYGHEFVENPRATRNLVYDIE